MARYTITQREDGQYTLRSCGIELGVFTTREAAEEDKAYFKRAMATFTEDFDYNELADEFGTALADAAFTEVK